MIFTIMSLIIAVIAFITSWYIHQSKFARNIKLKLIIAFISFGAGLLLNLIRNSILGDIGLLLVIGSVIYLLAFWIKMREKMFAL